MSTVFEIPTQPFPSDFSVSLGGTTYNMSLRWNIPSDCWVLDIKNIDDTLIVAGIPLVTGADLLEQYGYLVIGGAGSQMIVQTDNDLTSVPNFITLGVTGHLYFITNP